MTAARATGLHSSRPSTGVAGMSLATKECVLNRPKGRVVAGEVAPLRLDDSERAVELRREEIAAAIRVRQDLERQEAERREAALYRLD